MLLEAGVKVAADGRILEEANLQVREAALTGEAHAVEKQANATLPEDAPLGDRISPITDAQRDRILEQNNQMASQGLRVLGFASKLLSELPPQGSEDASEKQLTWLGLVGMLDAPRLEVRDAVAKCRRAGIRPVMITGDHQLTAKAIAQDLGIAQANDATMTGKEIERCSDEELKQVVENISVYARVSPEHKLRIVQALRHRNHIVWDTLLPFVPIVSCSCRSIHALTLI
jgi:magnesium-transporting ATPase (P-type)